jgi:hypothetical protein
MPKFVTRRERAGWLGLFLGIAAAGLLAIPLSATAAWAQGAALPLTLADVGAAVVRTPAEMRAFDVANPRLPAAMAPFLPTMDFEQYRQAKQGMPTTAAPMNAPVPVDNPVAAPNGPPLQGPVSCNGIGQNAPLAQGFFPPDTHGAVGVSHFVQIVNSAIRIMDKAAPCPNVLNTFTLNGFFGYGAQSLFDPRVVYDLSFNRWIVSAEAFAESSTVQLHFIAVSTSSNANGSYFIYPFNMRGLLGTNVFWDFPQLGYDEEAVILTGNMFNPGYIGSQVFFFAKHRMYAGLGFSFCFNGAFFDNFGTIAPPIVLDQSPYTVTATSLTGNPGAVRLRKYTGTGQVCATFLAADNIADAFNIGLPPNAPQPGTAQVLDTSDTRFVNASTQFGEPVFGQPVKLWQTRSVLSGSNTAVSLSYRINADALTIEEECVYNAAVTSFNFNASIAANGPETAFITFSSTDPTNGLNAQVRFTGKKKTDGCGTLTPGTANNTSANPLTGNFDPNFNAQRWGDYSAVTLDPLDNTKAWAVNEKIQTNPPIGCNGNAALNCWKSRIFNMVNP